MSRHYHDPGYVPMFDVDNIALNFTGVRRGEEVHFEGGSAALPGVPVHDRPDARSTTPTRRRPVRSGPDGIGNGLYSIHIRMLDGIDAGNTGVMMLHDGSIRGGDAFFDYIGAYTAANGRWKGELVNREHTPAKGERPLFGGHEVGIGFSGTYDQRGRGRRSHRARRQAQHPLQGGAAKAGGD